MIVMAEQEVQSPVSRKGSKVGSNQPLSPGSRSDPGRVPSPFEKAIDPTEIEKQLSTIGEQQLSHARSQLELTRNYPGRDKKKQDNA
jgi:hypothetical protein